MAVLPVFVLFAGALVMWVMRNRSARLGWSIGAAAAGLAWIGSLIISRSLPLYTSLSVWQPTEIFSARIELAVDLVNSKVLIAGATAVFSVILSTAVKLTEKEFRLRASVLAYGGIALLALLSTNLLTVTVTWALIDIVTFINGLVQEKENSVSSGKINQLVFNVAGLFAVIGAAIVNGIAGGTDDLAVPFDGYWATAVLLIAVVMRIGLVRFGSKAEDPSEGDKALRALKGVLPQAAALIILARQFAFGIPDELIGWIRVICVIGLATSGIQWAIGDEGEDKQRFFNTGIAFMGLLVSSVVSERPEVPITSSIGVMIVLGTLSRILRIHSPWQRIIPVIATLILVMPAWTIGAPVIQGAATGMEFAPTLWISIMSILGMGLLAVGVLREFFKTTQIWYVDDLARMLYALALFILVAIGFGLGGGTGSGIGVRSGIFSLMTAGIAVGIMALVRRNETTELKRMRGAIGWNPGEPLARAGRGMLNWSSKSLRLIGGILEGEGAMLWVFVVLMMIQLAIGVGNR